MNVLGLNYNKLKIEGVKTKLSMKLNEEEVRITWDIAGIAGGRSYGDDDFINSSLSDTYISM